MSGNTSIGLPINGSLWQHIGLTETFSWIYDYIFSCSNNKTPLLLIKTQQHGFFFMKSSWSSQISSLWFLQGRAGSCEHQVAAWFNRWPYSCKIKRRYKALMNQFRICNNLFSFIRRNLQIYIMLRDPHPHRHMALMKAYEYPSVTVAIVEDA